MKWKEVVSHLNIFTQKWSKITAQKKQFWGEFCKDQENNDQELIQQGLGGYTASIRTLCFPTRLQSLPRIFLFIKCVKSPGKNKFLFSANFALIAGFLLVAMLLSASVKRCLVSHRRDFKKDTCNPTFPSPACKQFLIEGPFTFQGFWELFTLFQITVFEEVSTVYNISIFRHISICLGPETLPIRPLMRCGSSNFPVW